MKVAAVVVSFRLNFSFLSDEKRRKVNTIKDIIIWASHIYTVVMLHHNDTGRGCLCWKLRSIAAFDGKIYLLIFLLLQDN